MKVVYQGGLTSRGVKARELALTSEAIDRQQQSVFNPTAKLS